jgi:hypothetical protein
MADFTVAADEYAVNKMMNVAEAMLGMITKSGSGSLGPFTAGYSASAAFSGGTISLVPPNGIHIDNCQLDYSITLSFSFDLSDILPNFCLPQICVPIPFDGELCSPSVCVDWPSVTIPVTYADTLSFSADLTLNVHLGGMIGPSDPNWVVDAVIVGIPYLQLSPAASAILTAVGFAAAVALAPIPFIGPFLSIAVAAMAATIGVAGVTGLLGQILTPFVNGRTFNLYNQPDVIEVLAAAPPLDPVVEVKVTSLTASVVGSDKNELVLAANIAP